MRLKVLFKFLLLLQMLKEYLAGVIQPELADSVLPYRNNVNAIGKYTFTFKTSTQVPSNPRITIDFPEVYPKIMNNVATCSGYVNITLKNDRRMYSCSVNGNQVVFDLSKTYSYLDAGTIIIDLYNVVNPSGVQGIEGARSLRRRWQRDRCDLRTGLTAPMCRSRPRGT